MDPGRGPAPRAGNPAALSSLPLWVEPTGWAPAGSPGAYPNLAWLRIAFGVKSHLEKYGERYLALQSIERSKNISGGAPAG